MKLTCITTTQSTLCNNKNTDNNNNNNTYSCNSSSPWSRKDMMESRTIPVWKPPDTVSMSTVDEDEDETDDNNSDSANRDNDDDDDDDEGDKDDDDRSSIENDFPVGGGEQDVIHSQAGSDYRGTNPHDVFLSVYTRGGICPIKDDSRISKSWQSDSLMNHHPTDVTNQILQDRNLQTKTLLIQQPKPFLKNQGSLLNVSVPSNTTAHGLLYPTSFHSKNYKLREDTIIRMEKPTTSTIAKKKELKQENNHGSSFSVSHRSNRLQQLQATAQSLQDIPLERRDMNMYLNVLEVLAAEYLSQGQETLALEMYQQHLQRWQHDLVTALPSKDVVSLYCQMAQVYVKLDRLDLAMEQLEMASMYLDHSIPCGSLSSSFSFSSETSGSNPCSISSSSCTGTTTSSSCTTTLLNFLKLKGNVLYRMGRLEESLQVYELALVQQQQQHGVNHYEISETAHLLNTIGKLCVQLKRIRPAITYFTRQMEFTIAELGPNHLCVSRILHELATLYDEELGGYQMALKKLNQALTIEMTVLLECQNAIVHCAHCNFPLTNQMCTMHETLKRDISNQIHETKRAQGLVHFKMDKRRQVVVVTVDDEWYYNRFGSCHCAMFLE